MVPQLRKGQLTKAWTIGHEKNYDIAIANAHPNDPIRKLGRNDPSEPGYEGGAVFHSPQDAQAYIDNNHLPWAVYELALPNGWPLDVDASNEHIEGFARLINNATITQKVPQPGVPTN